MSRYAAVVRLYREGATNPEIAERLNLAPNTVKSYLSRARRDGDLPQRLSADDPRHCPSCGAPSSRWRHEPPPTVPASIRD